MCIFVSLFRITVLPTCMKSCPVRQVRSFVCLGVLFVCLLVCLLVHLSFVCLLACLLDHVCLLVNLLVCLLVSFFACFLFVLFCFFFCLFFLFACFPSKNHMVSLITFSVKRNYDSVLQKA